MKETNVKCFGCKKGFRTTRLKNEYEEYRCGKCGHRHYAELNEVDGGWIHSECDDAELTNA